MKDIREYINEGIFDINPNLSEAEVLKLLAKTSMNRNESDGTKDAFGNPLKKGDIVIIPCPGDKNGNMLLAIYEEGKGKFITCKYTGDPRYRESWENPREERVACWKVIKYNF